MKRRSSRYFSKLSPFGNLARILLRYSFGSILFNLAAINHFEQAVKNIDFMRQLSQIEHRRWEAYKVLTGWIPSSKEYQLPASANQDKIRKVHSCLCDFEELSQKEKDKDQTVISSIQAAKIIAHLK